MTYKPKTKKALWVSMKSGIKPNGSGREAKPKRKSYAVSKTRAKELREYRILKTKFLIENPFCEALIANGNFLVNGVCGTLMVHASEDVHHKKGRAQKMLLKTEFWMPVCRRAHNWIGDNKGEAKARGWILPNWNSPK